MSEHKSSAETNLRDFVPPQEDNQRSAGTSRTIEAVRLGLTVLGLAASITILGTAGDALSVYNQTHLGANYFLPLWPTDFDIRPTVALVVSSAIITLASIISIVASKAPAIRSKPMTHNSLSILAPTVCLIAGLIGTSFFYGVNTSSVNHSLQSWTCQWSAISMDIKPHWNTLCKESKVSLYLMILMIPLQVLVVGTSAFAGFTAKKEYRLPHRKGSPAMS